MKSYVYVLKDYAHTYGGHIRGIFSSASAATTGADLFRQKYPDESMDLHIERFVVDALGDGDWISQP